VRLYSVRNFSTQCNTEQFDNIPSYLQTNIIAQTLHRRRGVAPTGFAYDKMQLYCVATDLDSLVRRALNCAGWVWSRNEDRRRNDYCISPRQPPFKYSQSQACNTWPHITALLVNNQFPKTITGFVKNDYNSQQLIQNLIILCML